MKRYIEVSLWIVLIVLFMAVAERATFADTTQSRDGDGQKMQGGAFGTIRSASGGTKGFKCWSTLNRISWEIKAVASNSTTGTSVGYKMFYNGNESLNYPVSDKFFQWNNAPSSKAPTITSVCQRAYSSAATVGTTFYGVFQ